MLFFVSENPPKKAKKSKKLTIAEKNPPKKPPNTLRKSPFFAGLQERGHQLHALPLGRAVAVDVFLHREGYA